MSRREVVIKLTPRQAEIVSDEIDRIVSDSESPAYAKEARQIVARIRKAILEAGDP